MKLFFVLITHPNASFLFTLFIPCVILYILIICLLIIFLLHISRSFVLLLIFVLIITQNPVIRRIQFGAKNILCDIKDNQLRDKKITLNKPLTENVKKEVLIKTLCYSISIKKKIFSKLVANIGSKVGTIRLRKNERSIIHDTTGAHDLEENSTSTKIFEFFQKLNHISIIIDYFS